uniref:Actinodin1 n=1 Tax=Acanthochromis polyacanthus TaxID=80966 RepID=A0A3Q1FXX0_9TELE
MSHYRLCIKLIRLENSLTSATSASRVTSAFAFLCFFVAFLSAGPVVKKSKGDADAALHRRLIRNRRNISWYKQHSDFWNWYKFFTDNGNQEAVQEMDRIYLAYLQNKNRAEGRRSYKAYLRHLGEIYKSCADSDDPNCVASHTTRPKPEPPKPAPVKTCDPTKDSYCLYIALVQGKSPYQPLVLPAATPAPAPAKVPAPLFKKNLSVLLKYLPLVLMLQEQKAELLRICSADDVECLQYHLRAAHGYTPSAGPLPSYAHLGCDPKTDPTCKLNLVQKAPSGLYVQYPNCDPRDPFCAYGAPRAPNPAGPGSCNPLFEEGCNPLTATKFATPPEAYKAQEKEAAALRVEQNSDPYAMYRDTYANANRVNDHYAMYRQQFPFSNPSYEEPPQEERHPLGPPGKTKEGHDCFIGYDRECFPVKPTEPRSGVHRRIPYPAEAYEPHLNADGTRNGVLEPSNPHCDPEYDRDCRLRRFEPEQTHANAQPGHHAEEHSQGAADSEQQEQEQYETEPYQSGQEEPHMPYQPLSQGMTSLQDILRHYGDQFPDQDVHRAYADDYRKK